MDSPLYRGKRQAYVKTGKYVNKKNPLSHHQLAALIKFMGKELANGRECQKTTIKRH